MGRMAISQTREDDIQVYLSFTLNDLLTAQTRQAHVRELLQKKFGVREVKQIVHLEDGGNEVVFKIATPALHTTGMLRSYFESLRFVMKATQEFAPHFTQSVREIQ